MGSHPSYFAASIRFNRLNNHPYLILKDEEREVFHIWLLCIHPTEREELLRYAVVRQADITVIWHMTDISDRYQFDERIGKARELFEKWYAANVNIRQMHIDFARMLALPCFLFDHAEGYAAVTQWLAYNCEGHITELRPDNFRWCHQHLAPPDFIGPVNHARGGLKTRLHRGIWSSISSLLKHGGKECTCGKWEVVSGRYFAALTKTEAYPLEDTFPKSSVNKILDLLKDFNMTEPEGACSACTSPWNVEVLSEVDTTWRYLDGLCIDCMCRSNYKNRNEYDEYWMNLGRWAGRWDSGCRVRHGEPSWYVSWCGRDDFRQQLLSHHRDGAPLTRSTN